MIHEACEKSLSDLLRSFSRVAECLPFAAGHQIDILSLNSRAHRLAETHNENADDYATMYREPSLVDAQ